MDTHAPVYPLTLLFDGACPVCALEMDHLRERDTQGRLAFVDIAMPGFDPAALGLSMPALQAEIHALTPGGRVLHGVEVLRLAYAAAGLGWLWRPTGWRGVKPVADVAYRWVARHRQPISTALTPAIRGLRAWRAWRTARRMRACHDGACGIESRGGRHG